MKLPAWMVRGEKPQLDGVKINTEGLTFQEWLDAAEIVAIRPDVRHEYVAAWERGEDPTEYRNPEKKPRRGLKMSDDLDGVHGKRRR